MKIVIAPDSFKESLSTEKCCRAIKAGFSIIFPDAHYICLPIADGGRGTIEAMVAAAGDNIVTFEIYGPTGGTVNAFYGLTGGGKTAVIEMVAASDLMLVAPEKCNPLLASSFGTEELIRHTLNNGIRHIILDIGGSAAVGGGVGIVQALGVRFPDAGGQMLAADGGNLTHTASIEMDEYDPRLANCHIKVTCDVGSPLVRARSTAAVFGPQKGTTSGMVEELEQGLQNYTRVLQQQTEISVCQTAGGGAAGGMGIAAAVSLNAGIKPDIEIVLDVVSLVQAVQGTALVIIRERRIDSQTASGKALLGVASVAKQFNAPVIGIAGILGNDVEVVRQYGIDAVFSILPRLAPLAEVLASGETSLFNSARNIVCAIKVGQGVKD